MPHTVSYPPDVLRKLQMAELEILDAVAELCAKHNISWFLEGGTALGAIRHQGFIPWDDDVDIGMLRCDYDRFLSIAESELPDKFELHHPGKTDRYAVTFAKVCKRGTRFWTQETIDAGFNQGIFIDIFPYDKASKNPAQRKRQLSMASRYTKMLYLYYSGNLDYPTPGPTGALIRAGFRVIHAVLKKATTAGYLHQQFAIKTRCYKGFESDESIDLSLSKVGPISTSVISSTTLVEFEERLFPVPRQYGAYLEWMYGDSWVELPPVEKRKNHAPRVLDFGAGTNVLEPSESGQ